LRAEHGTSLDPSLAPDFFARVHESCAKADAVACAALGWLHAHGEGVTSSEDDSCSLSWACATAHRLELLPLKVRREPRAR
jgi:TPR repeat protein